MDAYRDAAPAARHAVDIASDKQGADILLIDVHEISSFADYLVILSAGSVRQIQALANDLTEAVESKGLDLHHREGANESGWVLLDFGDLVVHVFSPEQRDFYRLEQVWSKGKTLLHIQ
ncbi:MAG: ribosome silencing factor [Dehalococcoidia bacterium]